MRFRFMSYLISICLIEFVSCEIEDDHASLYNEVFIKTSAKLDKSAVKGMLSSLKEYSIKDNDWPTVNLIDEVLKKSEVTENGCKSHFYIGGKVTGRARQLLAATKLELAKFCKDLWETSSLQSIDSLDERDKQAVSSMIESMIDANGGIGFSGTYSSNMPYLSAQRGILRYIKQKARKNIWLSKHDKLFRDLDEFVYGPCGRVADKLEGVVRGYVDLLYRFGPLVVNAIAQEWAQKAVICANLQGSGYSSKPLNTLRKDLYENIRSNRL